MEASEEKIDDKYDDIKEEKNKLMEEDNEKETNEIKDEKESIEKENSEKIESEETTENSNNSNSIICNIYTFFKLQYTRIGYYFQDKLLNCSKIINVSNNHTYLFLLFFLVGLYLLIQALLMAPLSILKAEKFLVIICSGNISQIISHLLYYGSDTFFELIADKDNTNLIFSHILFTFVGLSLGIFSIIIDLDWMDITLVVVIIYTSLEYFILFLPGKEKVIDFLEKTEKFFSDIKNIFCICKKNNKEIDKEKNQKLSNKIKDYF